MEIPGWIREMYYIVDKNHDDYITKEELNNLDRKKSGIGSIYVFDEGMSLESFVNKNRSIFSGFITYEGDPVAGRQILNKDNKLVQTKKSRKNSNDTKESLEVAQGEYAIVDFSKDKKLMQTYGLGPCVAVTIYDKINKKGFLAHIDTPKKASGLNGIIYQLKNKGFDLENCEVRIIGGQTGSSMDIVKNIQSAIENHNLTLNEMDVLGCSVRAIQLDLETGEVTDYAETIHTRNDTDITSIQTLLNDNLKEHKFDN